MFTGCTENLHFEMFKNMSFKFRDYTPHLDSAGQDPSMRRKIRQIESNTKCRYLKKLTFKGTLRQMFYLSEAPSPPVTPYSVWCLYR